MYPLNVNLKSSSSHRHSEKVDKYLGESFPSFLKGNVGVEMLHCTSGCCVHMGNWNSNHPGSSSGEPT